MDYFVIGEDKSLSDAYTAEELNAKLLPMDTDIATIKAAISALQISAAKIRNITAGAAAPSGGANGDIYIQY